MYYLENFQDYNNPNVFRIELRESSDEGDFSVSTVTIKIPSYELKREGSFVNLVTDDGRVMGSVNIETNSPHQLFTMEAN